MSGHAKLSPSASHRWMNCPGSVALIGDESSTTNQAAMLGTAAHKIIEIMVRTDVHDAREFAGGTLLVKAAGDEETEYYPAGTPALDPEHARPGWFMFIADEKMIEGVQQTIDEVDRIKDTRFDPKVFSEVYLDGSWLDSRFGGSIDVRIVDTDQAWLDIVDHKNGYLFVDAKDNDQGKQYAVLAAHEHPEVDGVTFTISQPNSPHAEGLIRSVDYTVAQLREYEVTMKKAADATDKPNAPLRAGDWCLWCSAKTRCKAYDAMLMEEASADFDDEEPPAALPMPKSTTELAHKAKWIDVIRAWCNAIEGDIQRELENDNVVGEFGEPEWKLVRGRAKRRLINPIETVRRLTGTAEELGPDVAVIGLADEDLWVEPKIKTPAQLEKLGVGKEQRKLVKLAVKELAFMPNGKLTIAPIYDPREAVTALDDAANEFMEDDEDGDDFA